MARGGGEALSESRKMVGRNGGWEETTRLFGWRCDLEGLGHGEARYVAVRVLPRVVGLDTAARVGAVCRAGRRKGTTNKSATEGTKNQRARGGEGERADRRGVLFSVRSVAGFGGCESGA